MSNLNITIGGVEFKNPVMTASGTFGSGMEYGEFVDLNRLGAVVTKGTIVPPNSLVAGIPAKVIKTLDEKGLASIHAQAIKYKTLWTERYGLLPNGGGESYHGEKIV